MSSQRLFSGIQPTGGLHIGNYLGALKNWVSLQNDYQCIYCVVDLHAITIPYEVEQMLPRIREAAVMLLAVGIDPGRSKLFVQSHVPEHTELTWVFNCVTPMGDLSRMTQFKEKSELHQSVNIGLFDYPVLQAADILLYKASHVPVGEDQLQHLELSRRVAKYFNNRFGETFPKPQAIVTGGARILGLDGKSKMSKSLGNTIELEDDRETVQEKLRGAFTDPQRLRRKDPGRPELCNIFALHTYFSDADTQEQIEEGCRTAAIGCFECKQILAENISDTLEPIQGKARQIRQRSSYVDDVLREGATWCAEMAKATMEEVRRRVGIRGG